MPHSDPPPTLEQEIDPVLTVADLRIKPVRPYGMWVSGVIVIAIVVLVAIALARANIDYAETGREIFDPEIISGMLSTLLVSVLAMAIGIVLGLFAAVMRISQNPVFRVVSGFYIWLFRGVPLLVQLLIWFNLALVSKTLGIPGIFSVNTNTVMTPFVAALCGLGIAEGAYVAEIVRGGIAAVPLAQRSAAAALGMSKGLTMRRVVLPQALPVMVPPLGNEFIIMLKNSSLASTISYVELLRAANNIYTNNLLVVELLLTASIWYLVLTTVFSFLQHLLETWLGRSSGRPATTTLSVRLLHNLRPGRSKSA